MVQQYLPNTYRDWTAAYERGEARGRDNKLRGLASLYQSAPQQEQASVLSQMAGVDPEFAAKQEDRMVSREDRRREQLAGMARGWKNVPSEQRQAYYERFIAPAVSAMGFGDLGPYDETAVDGVATQILAAYGGGTPGGAVQSTFVDAQGNRVAIMRDGSTSVLGQNAPNNQIIDTGNGFFGVNKGNLSASPVMVGGQPQQAPQPSLQAGLYQTPAGMVRIGEGLTPEQQQAALADIQAGGTAQNVQLPPRNVAPQQYGGGQQLRSAPKEVSQETFSQPQAVTGPDGKVRYVQFGNRGGTREVQGYSAPPTDRDAKPPTEGERKAATLLRRLTGSLSQLERAVREDPESASPNLGAEAARRLPFIGDAAANTITPAARQRVEAAQLDILDAALTLGTGAAYTREQLEGYRRSFFPQIGDSQTTIQDKQARLQNVIEAAKIAAGRASPENPERPAPASKGGWSIQRVD